MNRFAERVIHLLDAQKAFVIAKILDSHGSSPRSDGWMLISPDGDTAGSIGGGALEGKVLELAGEVLAARKSMVKEFKLNSEDQDGLNMICGGDVKIQIDYVDGADEAQAGRYKAALREMEEKKVIYIIGAGHVGLAVAGQLDLIEIPVVVMDDRGEFANKQRFPKAKEVKVLPGFADIFAGYDMDKDSYVVIVTRGHKWDLEVLWQALQTKAGYIGMIGSRRKISMSYQLLRERGATGEMLARVNAPIGLDIPCETPEEIAVSIAGKILCAKYGKNSR
ncbi:MAG: XdhC/CoxI family protein [Oscillospiraceae bacterium]|nr:XdhC/CoxI family protein [Oscillospiraceae bacterium]